MNTLFHDLRYAVRVLVKSPGFSVAAIHCKQQVGLFRLGRQSRAGTTSLYIDNYHWQFGDHTQPHGFALQADARTAGGGNRHRATKGSSTRGGHRGDFIFGLKRCDTEVLEL